ncbi:MAG: hypothetical protein M1308_10760 [Actinobacteria bacterium]|nr:hypothetical protein [Actinomycetota bacterium]
MDIIVSTFISALNNIILFIPQFISGFLILLIGLIVANIARVIIEKGAEFLNIGKLLSRAHVEGEEIQELGSM